MLLRNHGTLAIGDSVPGAFLTAYFLERSCAMQVATLAGNRPISWPKDEVKALVARQAAYVRGKLDLLAWAPLLRKLDRIDPGYKS
jgi:ribulose-5-phosphate 4-epimerase/fuculose-1-phosphate aldolase